MFWISSPAPAPDQHVAFRGVFELDASKEVELRSVGASWYTIWVDGEYLNDGPARYPESHPQYDRHQLHLAAGRHVVAFHVQYFGVETRMLTNIPPYLDIQVMDGDSPIQVAWKCQHLAGYQSQVRRINPELGWIDWCDTRAVPVHWEQTGFDDSNWGEPVSVDPGISTPEPISIGEVNSIIHELTAAASGPLAERFGYMLDDVPARFFLRDLECKDVPRAGTWRRYDLGRVRLGRPCFELTVPEGTIVQFATSETLAHGRVQPYITLSAGASCNLDHYVARGGKQVFFPNIPKGGRFLEIHVMMPKEVYDAGELPVEFHREAYIERTYWADVEGAFSCEDPLINAIWQVGVDTLRSCSEDALTDNPTRERGQWTGDVVAVGLDIATTAFSDLRLFRRALIHSAQSARADGMIAGHTPSHVGYIGPYAAQWTNGCLRYHDATGDLDFLREMYDKAKANIGSFERFLTEDGLVQTIADGGETGITDFGWVFIDWGYVPNPGPSDMAMNMHFLDAVRGMKIWCARMEHDADLEYYTALEERVKGIIQRWLEEQLSSGNDAWNRIGYHRATFALRLNLLDADRVGEALAFMKDHMQNCFPNKKDAPRNDDPTKQRTQLITPYFAHYAMPVLIEHGEGEFVLEQYRRCWGWMLEDNRTTLVEVFDTRWSHCHQWAGCPTWQLTRYCLGLHPRFSKGDATYELRFIPMGLSYSKGVFPLHGDGNVAVRWHVEDDVISYEVNTSRTITLILPLLDGSIEQKVVTGTVHLTLQKSTTTNTSHYAVVNV